MKTLLILRHAKSSWDDSSISDHDRPLNQRGLKTAPLMGTLLKANKLVPDLILSSTALRAVETARLVAQAAEFNKSIPAVASFYPGDPVSYIETLKTQVSAQSIMIIGHNPGLEDLVYTLTGHKHDLPTAALAQVQLPIGHWSQLTTQTKGTLIDIFRPKEIFKNLGD
jgi:phosphohistidine phosphatase